MIIKMLYYLILCLYFLIQLSIIPPLTFRNHRSKKMGCTGIRIKFVLSYMVFCTEIGQCSCLFHLWLWSPNSFLPHCLTSLGTAYFQFFIVTPLIGLLVLLLDTGSGGCGVGEVGVGEVGDGGGGGGGGEGWGRRGVGGLGGGGVGKADGIKQIL